MQNLSLRGQDFTDRYEDQVEEMKRSFLQFMKSMHTRISGNVGADADVAAGAGAGAGADDQGVKVTSEGYPIIPKEVTEQGSKKKAEDILRAYLGQHYCKFR